MYSSEPIQPCWVSWCGVPAISRKHGALCSKHYQREYRGFNPEECEVNQDWIECSVIDCPHPVDSKGLCRYHGSMARRGKLEAPSGMKVRDICSVSGCDERQEARGVCHTHYCQMRYYGLEDIDSPECAVDGCVSTGGWSTFCTKHLALVKKYNLSLDEINRISGVTECENPGCHNTKRLHIDHDHTTGEVRGVLCGTCNAALGMLSEDESRIMGLIQYMK